MKRVVSHALALILVLSLSSPALSGGMASADQTVGSLAISLQSATTIAARAFPIPAGYSLTSSSYDAENGRWSLQWYNANKDCLFYSIDGETGEVCGYGSQSADGSSSVFLDHLPAVTRLQAVAAAQAALSRVSPTRAKQVCYAPAVADIWSLRAFWPRFESAYSIKYDRLIHGVPYPDEGITVIVDGTTGAVVSYSAQWSDGLSLPSPSGMVDSSVAAETILARADVAARYWLPHYRNEYMASCVVNKPFVLVDAVTGEVIDETDSRTCSCGSTQPAAFLASQTPEFRNDNVPGMFVASLVPVAEAEQTARKVLQLGSEYRRTRADLYRDLNCRVGEWQWRLGLQKGDDYNTTVEVGVDAKTGNVVEFELPTPTDSEGQILERMSPESAQAMAQAYIAAREPELAKGVQIMPADRPFPAGATAYSFRFGRFENGLEVIGDGFTVTVDAHAGKIRAYHLNWNASAPFVDNPAELTRHDALRQVIEKNIRLSYQRVYNGSQTVIRPVYALFAPAYWTYDLATGVEIGIDALPVPTTQPLPDTRGHRYEGEAQTLAECGVISGATPFRPDEKITLEEFLTIASGAIMDRPKGGVRSFTFRPLPYNRDVADQLMLRGEAADMKGPVTRGDAARYLLRAYGLDAAARQDVYKLPSGDSAVMTNRGYLGLAWQLGILDVQGNSLQPARVLTRAEAAALIVRMLRVES